MIQGDLVAYVAANSSVAAKAGGRAYWLTAPQDSSALSHVVLTQVSGERDLTHGGESGLLEMRLQIDFVATNFADAAAMREAVCAALNGYKGAMGSSTINAIQHAGDLPDQYEDGAALYMASSDFMVSYQK
ncbi:MAG: DUF3168 domain-containing protein [Opitutaceae bacterium]|jgi:hypothetical protein